MSFIQENTVLDKGHVRLVRVFGDQEFIAESARQSTSGKSKGPELDGKLIRRLWRDGHTSPFEMASCTWDLKVPLFVVQQILRHRTGRFNQFSFRYSDGISDGRTVDGTETGLEWYVSRRIPNDLAAEMDCQCRSAVEVYRAMVKDGVPSEHARGVLPINIFTRLRLQFDVNNAMKFFRLRCANDVQEETRIYATTMRSQMRPFFPDVFVAEEERGGRA